MFIPFLISGIIGGVIGAVIGGINTCPGTNDKAKNVITGASIGTFTAIGITASVCLGIDVIRDHVYFK